jgi:probable HAF family extracellular repeat protein
MSHQYHPKTIDPFQSFAAKSAHYATPSNVGEPMKPNRRGITLSVVLVALAMTSFMSAQNDQHTKDYRYRLVDLGTLGGPNSGVPGVFYEIDGGTAGAQVISADGTVAGTADTSISDPLCYFDDCFYPNTFQWRSGTMTSLGALPGAQWSGPNWISGNGLIAGISENGENDPLIGLPQGRAVLWQDGQITDLGTLQGGYESFAWGVNNYGQVVGDATNGIVDPYSYYYATILGISNGTQTRAFLWDKDHGMQDLGTLGGPDAWAAVVNEQGDIAGISFTNFMPNANNGPTCATNVPSQDPFFWNRESGMIDIGSFGGTCGAPQAINKRGQVVGGSYFAGNATVHAFLWEKSGHPRLKDLGTLGGENSAALWIDDAGDVVGYADVHNPPGCTGVGCVHHAFLWKHGVMTDLGSIGTDPCSRAISINSKGQIVGATAAVCGGTLTHGFLWEKGGPAIDLNTLVNGTDMGLTMPLYINDRGEIAGNGVLANGDVHAFLLIPCDGSGSGHFCEEPNDSTQPAASSVSVPRTPHAKILRGNRLGFPALGSRN